MMKAVPLGRYSTVEKDLSCQTFASLSFCFSLSVLRSLMFGSHWYSSSRTTSGGTSPVSLHVMSETRMQFLVPKCFFFFFFFFFYKESRPRAWGFFFEKDGMTGRHRGEREEMRCVNKRVSIIFVTFCSVCLWDDHHSRTRLPLFVKRTDSRQEDKLYLFVISSLVPFFLHAYTSLSVSPPSEK